MEAAVLAEEARIILVAEVVRTSIDGVNLRVLATASIALGTKESALKPPIGPLLLHIVVPNLHLECQDTPDRQKRTG